MTERVFEIGELSRRTGISTDVIRAWERRYGLLSPARSQGNYRLYSPADLTRLRLMKHYTDQHIRPARAAELVRNAHSAALDCHPGIPKGDVRKALAVMRDSLERFDDAPADALLARLLEVFSRGVVLRDVVLPYLRELGDRWQAGETDVAQEHFASSVLERWMLSMAAGWGRAGQRRAVLGCVPGEHPILGLLAFGLVLRDLGWRVVYLGGDVPLETLARVAGETHPDAVVLSATMGATFADAAGRLDELARAQTLAVGGRGVATSAGVVTRIVHMLPTDLVVAAQSLTVRVPRTELGERAHAGSRG